VRAASVLKVRRRVAESAPLRGLPGPLPEGEALLWQGSPDWRSLARHAFHVKGVAIYFAIILAWCLASSLASGTPALHVARSTLRLCGLALVPMALLGLYSWAVAKSTIYTITSKRVTLGIGLAVPMTLNLPFSRIAGAGLKVYPGNTGDIPLTLAQSEKLAYLLVWPHARPWKMARAEPMLRGIPDAPGVASILARALAAEAGVPPAAIHPMAAADAAPGLVAQAA
jgi:hypothetical protein